MNAAQVGSHVYIGKNCIIVSEVVTCHSQIFEELFIIKFSMHCLMSLDNGDETLF